MKAELLWVCVCSDVHGLCIGYRVRSLVHVTASLYLVKQLHFQVPAVPPINMELIFIAFALMCTCRSLRHIWYVLHATVNPDVLMHVHCNLLCIVAKQTTTQLFEVVHRASRKPRMWHLIRLLHGSLHHSLSRT